MTYYRRVEEPPPAWGEVHRSLNEYERQRFEVRTMVTLGDEAAGEQVITLRLRKNPRAMAEEAMYAEAEEVLAAIEGGRAE